MANGNNPIGWVGSSGHTVPVPSSYEWKLEDISSSDAGRDSNGIMHKEMIARAVALNLEWKYLTTAEAKTVLSAFDNETYQVNYLDPLAGGYTTKTFYTGNRSAPMYTTATVSGKTGGVWTNISFNIISIGDTI